MIDVLEFVKQKGWEYTIHGKELNMDCPFCGGKKRFNINMETGAYICNRQNNCGAKGFFKETSTSHKKKEVDIMSRFTDKDFDVINPTQEDYFKKRGISRETLTLGRVRNKNGVLCFFFTTEQGKACGIKYRTLDKKIWSEKDSIMTLLNWDRVPKDSDTLFITEGCIDMLSVLEIGIKNVVSIPNGVSNQEWIENHYSWLEKFKTIILCFDNDEAGKKCTEQTSARLSELNSEIKTIDLLFYKDLNEVLSDEEGNLKLQKILTNTKDITPHNTIKISTITADIDEEVIDWEDKNFNIMSGGLKYGEVFIFTGNSGCGKSSFVNNLISNLLNQNLKVYTHQGEFRPEVFKNNLYKILVRPKEIQTYENELKGKIYGKISKEIETRIDEWVGDRLIIHGSQTPTKKELLKTIEKMYKRNGIRIFFIDNLMTINIDGEDKYENQKQLFLELQALVKKYNLFLGIVAHPKKNNLSLSEVDQYIIHGASEIVNLANFVIYLKRLNDKEKEDLTQKGITATVGGVVVKDRRYGDVGTIKYWTYENKTGRFLNPQNQIVGYGKIYNWENL